MLGRLEGSSPGTLQRQTSWRRSQSGANPSPNPQFAVSRENTGNFLGFRLSAPVPGRIARVLSPTYARIPALREQGIFRPEQGFRGAGRRVAAPLTRGGRARSPQGETRAESTGTNNENAQGHNPVGMVRSLK